jgi:hypothetical protein
MPKTNHTRQSILNNYVSMILELRHPTNALIKWEKKFPIFCKRLQQVGKKEL